jgi:hypothetical protein
VRAVAASSRFPRAGIRSFIARCALRSDGVAHALDVSARGAALVVDGRFAHRRAMRTRACLAVALAVVTLPVFAPAQDSPTDVVGAAQSALGGVLGNAPASPGGPRSRRGPRANSAATPLAANAPRMLILAVADGYMQLPLVTFQNLRGVRPPPFNWESRGCSFGEISGPFRDSFDRACARHEFGYRNYGAGGLALDPTEGRRTRIDDRLHEDLNGLCHGEHRGLTETPCMLAAQTVYAGARAAGRNWFFTGPSARPPSLPTPSLPGFNNGANAGPIPGLPIPGIPAQPTGNTIPLPIPGRLPIPGSQ